MDIIRICAQGIILGIMMRKVSIGCPKLILLCDSIVCLVLIFFSTYGFIKATHNGQVFFEIMVFLAGLIYAIYTIHNAIKMVKDSHTTLKGIS